MPTSRVTNVTVAANTYLDSAKERLAKLEELAADPVNAVDPGSVSFLDTALESAITADNALKAFAVANAIEGL